MNDQNFELFFLQFSTIIKFVYLQKLKLMNDNSTLFLLII